MKSLRPILFTLQLTSLSSVLLAENPNDFTVKAALGEGVFTLSENRGKIVALHFLLKAECPVCLRHTHDFGVLAATTPEVIHVFLKPDSEAEIEAWAARIDRSDLGALPKIYRDPDAGLAKLYGIPGGYKFHGQIVHFPALIVLDADGKELFRHVGMDNSDRISTSEFTKVLSSKTNSSGN